MEKNPLENRVERRREKYDANGGLMVWRWLEMEERNSERLVRILRRKARVIPWRQSTRDARIESRRKKSIMASIYTPTSQHGGRRDVTKICETRIN